MAKIDRRWASGALVAALLAAPTAWGHPASNGYHYIGHGAARLSGSSCRATVKANENVLQKWSAGATNYTANAVDVVCPIVRRNLQNYGDTGSYNATRIFSLYVSVNDYSTLQDFSCYAVSQPSTNVNSRYFSSTLRACSNYGGCSASNPAYTGAAEIIWNQPFGHTNFVSNNVEAINLIVRCSIPKSGSILKAIQTHYYLNGSH